MFAVLRDPLETAPYLVLVFNSVERPSNWQLQGNFLEDRLAMGMDGHTVLFGERTNPLGERSTYPPLASLPGFRPKPAQ